MTREDQARDALAAIGQVRDDVARRVSTPGWYWPVLGAGAALLALGSGIGGLWGGVLLALGLLALVGDMVAYARVTGSWTMATMREQGAWTAWVMVVVIVGGVFASIVAGSVVVSAVAAVVMFVTVCVLGPRWNAAWVRSLREQP
ncbi:hypothetical protein [Nocardia sp. SSK8]|uniref:hypothetical protein n=1 Tax=Nocardia sp. SSK8 TaxID=3120154 RepID=UPI00300AD931